MLQTDFDFLTNLTNNWDNIYTYVRDVNTFIDIEQHFTDYTPDNVRRILLSSIYSGIWKDFPQVSASLRQLVYYDRQQGHNNPVTLLSRVKLIYLQSDYLTDLNMLITTFLRFLPDTRANNVSLIPFSDFDIFKNVSLKGSGFLKKVPLEDAYYINSFLKVNYSSTNFLDFYIIKNQVTPLDKGETLLYHLSPDTLASLMN